MKKVLGNVAIYIFAAFTIAVFGMLVSLTYQALQRIFPTSFENQIVGLVLFDIGAICWAVAFVFLCKSTAQYASAAVGFLAAFIGTLGMVAAEVILSGNLIETDPQQIGQWLVYGFIGVTALHVTMIYLYHGGAPDIKEKIDVGIARGEIVTEAIAQATKSLEAEKAMLAQTLTQEIVAQVKRDLNIPIPINDTVFDRRRHEADTAPLPILQPPATSQDERGDYTGIAKSLYHPDTRFVDEVAPQEGATTKPPFQPE